MLYYFVILRNDFVVRQKQKGVFSFLNCTISPFKNDYPLKIYEYPLIDNVYSSVKILL